MDNYSLGYKIMGRLGTEQVESPCAEGGAGRCVGRGEKAGDRKGPAFSCERTWRARPKGTNTLLASNIRTRWIMGERGYYCTLGKGLSTHLTH